MTRRCRICGEPIIFIPIAGWQHLSVGQWLDHDAQEERR